jgi:GAF domain-containing protein
MQEIATLTPETSLNKEIRRVQAMERYLTFNLDCQKELNDIVKVVSLICDTPIAFISMMGKDMQWIKAKVGVQIEQMPKTSLCIHALEMDEMLMVQDTIADPRFAHAAVVANDPYVRFYASANLKSYDGYNVGTLCVFDLFPKTLNTAQQEALIALANQVSHIMELDRALKLLKQQNSALAEIARIQSHEIRLPVSSIMGVMELIKDAGMRPNAEHLDLLDRSVRQLDEKIRLIVNETAI